ncbi:hypothetical protein V8C37DRAFT_419391 [Trichoderma ceciliae]
MPRKVSKQATKRRPPPSEATNLPQPYQHRPSKDGNLLFAKLPAEVRCHLWYLLLVKPSGSVIPLHVPRDPAVERFVSMEAAPDVTLLLNAVLQTCRLFYHDQEVHRVYYKVGRIRIDATDPWLICMLIISQFNVFQFRTSFDCLTYIAAITPSRRKAIRNITISLDPSPYDPKGVKSRSPGDHLLAVASLCPNLRVLRHEKFFYKADDLSGWADILTKFLTSIMAELLSLREIYIRGGRGESVQVECHMTRRNINLSWRSMHSNNWIFWPGSFSQAGEKTLRELWGLFRDRKREISSSYSEKSLEAAIATTPIKTLGEDRHVPDGSRFVSDSARSRANQKDAASSASSASATSAPPCLFNGYLPIDIRFPSNKSSPDLLFECSSSWYCWDAVFHSHLMLESRSKAYMDRILQLLKGDFEDWSFYPDVDSSRGQAIQFSPSKLIKHSWRLKWKSRDAKLAVLKELHRLGATWRRQR